MKRFFILSRVFVVLALLAISISSCSDDPEYVSPGKITMPVTTLDLYSLKGEISLPIHVENAEVEIFADYFTFSDVNITQDGGLGSGETSNAILPRIREIYKDGIGKYLMVLEYDYSGFNSVSGSFTMGYAGTPMAVKISFDCKDVVSVEYASLAIGFDSRLSVVIDKNGFSLPAWLVESMHASNYAFKGEHADEIDIRTVEGEDYLIATMKDTFAFTEQEKAKGYADIPLSFTLNYEGGSQVVKSDVRVYPSEKMEVITFQSGSISFMWDITKASKVLGVDYNDDGKPAVSVEKKKTYFARFGEPLDVLGKFETPLFISYGVSYVTEPDPETGGLVQREAPVFFLKGVRSLASGNYAMVVTVKKHKEPLDDKYVNYCITFIIK